MLVGCGGPEPLSLHHQTRGEPDSPECRSPLVRRADGLPEDPWVRDRPDPRGDPSAKAPFEDGLATLRLDGKAASRDRVGGTWGVDGVVGPQPLLVYELSPAAGTLTGLTLVIAEVRDGTPDLDGALRVPAADALPPGRPFRLDRPGNNLRVRTPAGDEVEQFTLRPATTYQVELQLQTSGRSAAPRPWPWPVLRFRTAG